MSNEKSKIISERYVNVFAELSHGNHILLENAKERMEGYHYETIASIIVAAFKFEAFLNHLGFLVIPFWTSIERLPHKNKLEILIKHLNVKVDRGSRPFQTLKELFQARDGIAHGKPEFLQVERIKDGLPNELDADKPMTGWETICTLEFAERACEDTERIAEVLWDASGLEKMLLRHNGFTFRISSPP
jgi:hypothetical protein